jgi:hypothetical protein
MIMFEFRKVHAKLTGDLSSAYAHACSNVK